MPPRRRKKSRVNKILVVTAVVALLLCVWSSVFSLTHTPDFIKNAIVTVSSPFTYLFDRAGGAIHGLFADSPDEAAYKARIEQLEQQLAAERAKTAQLQQLQLENAQLKEFLDISDQNRFVPTFIPTFVPTSSAISDSPQTCEAPPAFPPARRNHSHA